MRQSQGDKFIGAGMVLALALAAGCFLLPQNKSGGGGGDQKAPTAEITSPADGFATNLLTVKITGTAADPHPITSVVVFGCRDGATTNRDDPCYPQMLAAGTIEGAKMKPVVASSLVGDWESWEGNISFYGSGNSAQDYSVRVATMDDRGNFDRNAASITVTVGGPDTFGPEVTVIAPLAGQTVWVDTIPVVGKARDSSAISSITVDPGTGPVPAESLYGSTLDVWRTQVPLAAGDNTLTIVAKDSLNNTSTTLLHVVREDPNSNMTLVTTPSPVTLGYNAGADAEKPEHQVNLSDYYLDHYETNIADYMLCYYTLDDPSNNFASHHCSLIGSEDMVLEDVLVPAGSPKNPDPWDNYDTLIYPLAGRSHYPVRNIDKFSADWFCNWNGLKRLPTEAEWERAARAGATGPSFLPDGRLNPAGGNTLDCTTANLKGCVGHVTPVGSYPANPLGIYDLAGNVMEWVQDYYQDDFYSVLKPIEPVLNPLMNVEADSTCLYGSWSCFVNRGGAFTSGPEIGRTTFRNYYDDPAQWGMDNMIGFRCALDGP